MSTELIFCNDSQQEKHLLNYRFHICRYHTYDILFGAKQCRELALLCCPGEFACSYLGHVGKPRLQALTLGRIPCDSSWNGWGWGGGCEDKQPDEKLLQSTFSPTSLSSWRLTEGQFASISDFSWLQDIPPCST